MRFARIGPVGAEVAAVSDSSGIWRDIRAVPGDAAVGLPSVADVDLAGLPVVEPGRFGAPLARIGKIVCIGLNYASHAREVGATPPTEPIVFLKTPDTVVGAGDDVMIPRGSTKTDWEVELAVVIGAEARYLERPSQSRQCIAGYAVSNDVSERAFQLERGGQWDKGKNCETFNPLGPWIASAEEVPDPQNLRLRTWVNGELMQDGRTSDMIFGVDHLVWYLSQFMVLRPGDVINTGTPHGVAMSRPSLPYLKVGDVVELEIDGLGRQRQTMIAG